MSPVGTKDRCLEALPEITLCAGEAHHVVIGGLGSAGYAWGFEVEGSPGVIFVRASLLPLPPANPPHPALLQTSSVEHIFVIEALIPGKSKVRFMLRRPWERNIPPVRTLSVWVTVISGH
ncbi:MAG: protease inhibitor I42 family protein [Nitrosospira sp.]